jgi:hypothetical protein
VQNTKYTVLVQGGLAAIEVDAEGRLIPLACWSLVEDRGTMRSVIESIRERADVRYQPPEPPLTPEQAFHELREFDDLELEELRDAFGELRLFDAPGEWRLREPSAQVLIQLPKQKYHTAHAKCLIDLPDGSIVALTMNVSPGELFAGVRGPAMYRRCLVHLRANNIEQISPGSSRDEVTGLEIPVRGPTRTPHFIARLTRPEIPIVADSLTELLERALGCDGKLELEPIGFLTNDD